MQHLQENQLAYSKTHWQDEFKLQFGSCPKSRRETPTKSENQFCPYASFFIVFFKNEIKYYGEDKRATGEYQMMG